MLIPHFWANHAAHSYIEFIKTLSWYHMYCASNIGEDKADYVEGFESLEMRYKELWWDDEEEKSFSKFRPSAIQVVLDKVDKILKSSHFEDEHLENITDLLYDFLYTNEGDFRERYFDYQLEQTTQYDYPAGLFAATKELLTSDHSNEAIVTSFKFLDNHLQKLLNLSPHQYYGEELINKAFAPNSGMLQLGTTSSEQAGIRNFFSGANALFRNPSAHRFINFRDFDTQTIVAMVAVMSRLATELAKNSQQNTHGT